MILKIFWDKFTYETGLGIKIYVLDPNSDVGNYHFLADFSWQIRTKNKESLFYGSTYWKLWDLGGMSSVFIETGCLS